MVQTLVYGGFMSEQDFRDVVPVDGGVTAGLPPAA